MHIRYPALQNAALDREVEDHQISRGAWRDDAVLVDVRNTIGSTPATKQGKRQKVVLILEIYVDISSHVGRIIVYLKV